jgi:hypothetical protein
VERTVNAAEALTEAHKAYAAQAARQAEEVDNLGPQLAAHIKWLQENPARFGRP